MTIRHATEGKDASAELIKLSHSLDGEAAKLRSYYHDWAGTYEHDVAAESYQAPRVICDLLTRWTDDDHAGMAVLDAGCGTGLVGVELARRGYATVDGCDLSEEMIELAREKGAYRALRPGVDLNWDTGEVRQYDYDAVTCCGVFTNGHVLPLALNQLLKVAHTGSLVVVSTRNSYLRRTRFADHVSWLQRENRAETVEVLADAPYIAEEPASYWVLRRCA